MYSQRGPLQRKQHKMYSNFVCSIYIREIEKLLMDTSCQPSRQKPCSSTFWFLVKCNIFMELKDKNEVFKQYSISTVKALYKLSCPFKELAPMSLMAFQASIQASRGALGADLMGLSKPSTSWFWSLSGFILHRHTHNPKLLRNKSSPSLSYSILKMRFYCWWIFNPYKAGAFVSLWFWVEGYIRLLDIRGRGRKLFFLKSSN